MRRLVLGLEALNSLDPVLPDGVVGVDVDLYEAPGEPDSPMCRPRGRDATRPPLLEGICPGAVTEIFPREGEEKRQVAAASLSI